ncbi:hypothetical protein [Streptomyces murinus]|uniref:hypothetical protein n=1 Tax=Streptomyces murinus TaxID=33900 RepID=UPI00382D486C
MGLEERLWMVTGIVYRAGLHLEKLDDRTFKMWKKFALEFGGERFGSSVAEELVGQVEAGIKKSQRESTQRAKRDSSTEFMYRKTKYPVSVEDEFSRWPVGRPGRTIRKDRYKRPMD